MTTCTNGNSKNTKTIATKNTNTSGSQPSTSMMSETQSATEQPPSFRRGINSDSRQNRANEYYQDMPLTQTTSSYAVSYEVSPLSYFAELSSVVDFGSPSAATSNETLVLNQIQKRLRLATSKKTRRGRRNLKGVRITDAT